MALTINWTETRPAGDTDLNWSGYLVSSDGVKQIASVDSGRIYYSSNSGTSWTEVRPAGDADYSWEILGISDDGTKLLAGIMGGKLYYSSNSGASWSEIQPAGTTDQWYSVNNCLSTDGTKIFVTALGARAWYSSNSGASWTEVRPNGDTNMNYNGCAMSRDGTKLFTVVQEGRAYYSSNSGSTWTEVQPDGDNSRGYLASGMSGDGSKLMVSFSQPYAGTFYSTNSGSTWTSVTADSYSQAFAFSNDGVRAVRNVGNGNQVYYSTDGLQSWQDVSVVGPTNSSYTLSMSSDGLKVATSYGGTRLYQGAVTMGSDPVNTFGTTPARNGVAVTSTANATATVALITSDSLFDSAAKIARVDVHYVSPSGRQTAVITHTGHGLTGRTSWSSGAESGVWQKTRIVAFDADGARHVIDRSTIGTGEDLTLA